MPEGNDATLREVVALQEHSQMVWKESQRNSPRFGGRRFDAFPTGVAILLH